MYIDNFGVVTGQRNTDLKGQESEQNLFTRSSSESRNP